jgi:hypothetical protein
VGRCQILRNRNLGVARNNATQHRVLFVEQHSCGTDLECSGPLNVAAGHPYSSHFPALRGAGIPGARAVQSIVRARVRRASSGSDSDGGSIMTLEEQIPRLGFTVIFMVSVAKTELNSCS